MLQRLKQWARRIKRDVLAVYLAARDPRTPLPVRLFALVVAGYALSPIDLIPDFVPVLGYVDDVLLVPLGLWLVVKLLPPEVLASARAKAETLLHKPTSALAAAAIVLVWLALAAGAYAWYQQATR